MLRWVAAGVLEAAKGFRRVKGCQDMPALVAALRARDARPKALFMTVWCPDSRSVESNCGIPRG